VAAVAGTWPVVTAGRSNAQIQQAMDAKNRLEIRFTEGQFRSYEQNWEPDIQKWNVIETLSRTANGLTVFGVVGAKKALAFASALPNAGLVDP